MSVEAIIYQSVLSEGKPYQQLSNLVLDGLSTIDDALNTDSGRLYGALTYSAPTYTFSLYKDATRMDLVAQGTATTLGVMTLTARNDSGLSGSVNVAQYAADDAAIEAVCFLSQDGDLPMRGLDELCDYDPILGYADYHLKAFDYLKGHIVSRYKSIIFNPDFIDTHQINGGKGGYDLSRCINISVLRETSAHYAFARIAEKQGVEDNTFLKRSKASKDIVKAHLQSDELTFDTNLDRVEDRQRSFSAWKIARA